MLLQLDYFFRYSTGSSWVSSEVVPMSLFCSQFSCKEKIGENRYEALGNAGEAILQLELLLTVAAEAGEVESQAQACTIINSKSM